ncbi:hypothetical protein H4S06_006282, partial [Coemansia sp. BCRC 34490]
MMSFPQQSNFLFFGQDSSDSAYQHAQLGTTAGGGSAYFANSSQALMAAAAAAGHAGMYPTPGAIDTQQHQQHQQHTVTAAAAAAATGGAVGAEHRRSPSSVRAGSGGGSGAGVDHAQRRATHNAIERARRESLNGQFQDLASAVPALIHVRRPSKATIVEKSLDYIRTFKDHLGTRD